MNRSFAFVLILLALALTASACGGGGSSLTYKVLGTASEAKIAYTDAKGETEEATVALPWETDFGIGSDFDFKIGVENAGESGSITCEVWINERKVGGTSGVRLAECSGSFSGSKNSFSTDYRGRYDAKPEDAVVTMDEGEAMLATSAARAEASKATRTAAAAPTPTATPPPAPTVAPLPPITDLQEYIHDMDCAVHNEDLKLRAFSVLYPSGAVIQDCAENSDNYVLFSLDPDEDSEDAAFFFALGKLEFTPPDREAYVSNANRFLSMISTQLASQYAGENLNSESIAHQGETVFHQDMKAVVEDVPRLIRLVTVPNYDHGYGVFFMAMQKVDGAPEEAFPAFDEVTRNIIASIEFAPVEPTIGELTFATDITSGSEAIDPATTFPAGTTVVYGVFEYIDFYPSTEFAFVWTIDGEEVNGNEVDWNDKSAGKTWVNFANNDGMAPGEYEVRLSVNGELAQTGSFVIEGASAASWFNQGVGFYQQGDYEQAAAAFSQAIELDPNYASAYNNRGASYKALGDYEQAIRDYGQAIELDHDPLSWPYNNRGVVHYELDDYEQAIRDFDQALEHDPNYAAAYNNRGRAYYALGAYEQAISDYDQALELDPNYAVAYNDRGAAYGALGDYEQAISDLDRAIALWPDYGKAYLNRGRAYADQGDNDRAIADFRQVLEISADPSLRQQAEEQLRALGVEP